MAAQCGARPVGDFLLVGPAVDSFDHSDSYSPSLFVVPLCLSMSLPLSIPPSPAPPSLFLSPPVSLEVRSIAVKASLRMIRAPRKEFSAADR